MQCQCYTAPDGHVIVCDHCASTMIDALNDLLPGEQAAADLPPTFTASEYQGMTSLVNGWLDTLEPEQVEVRR